MKKIYQKIKSLSNLAPYLLIVFIYFFFIGVDENRKSKNNQRINTTDSDLSIDKLQKIISNNVIISNERKPIPVIPYKD